MNDADKLNSEIQQKKRDVCLKLREQIHSFAALRTFAQMRIESAKNSLCIADSWDDVLRLQGQVQEARALAKLEETVSDELGRD